MIKTLKRNLLDCIGAIYEQAEGCKLDFTFFKKAENELNQVSDYFKCSKTQSFFISVIFSLNYKSGLVDLKDLIEYFNCNPTRILQFHHELDHLFSKGILKRQKSRHARGISKIDDLIFINEKINTAILNYEPFPALDEENLTNIFELFEKVGELADQRLNNEIYSSDLFYKVNNLIERHKQFPLIKKIKMFHLGSHHLCVYLYLIKETLSGKEMTDIGQAMEKIFDNYSTRMNYMQGLLNGSNYLMELKLVDIIEANFFNDSDLKLSDFSIKILSGFDIHLFTNKTKGINIIDSTKMEAKKLIYNQQEHEQVTVLKTLLKPRNYKNTQKRLAQKNLPTGIAILLHGAPGTGKTASVVQLARTAGREIMKVEISESKSMWFGDSEKRIKRIFTDYRSFAKECRRMPILFFNEADAIISTRRKIGNSNVDQTENAIQNILLEELENFDGIFCATTNLVDNLDTAFERRFLFKIEFKKPDLTRKKQIWKLKIPKLNISECESLAQKFDFSGGQIENIIRKMEIHEIINGNSVDFSSIVSFCENEELARKARTLIGFNNMQSTCQKEKQ